MSFISSAFRVRGNILHKPCHVINIETRDDEKESIINGTHAANIAEICLQSKDINSDIFGIIETYQISQGTPQILHIVTFA